MVFRRWTIKVEAARKSELGIRTQYIGKYFTRWGADFVANYYQRREYDRQKQFGTPPVVWLYTAARMHGKKR